MFEITASELLSCVSTLPSQRQFALRHGDRSELVRHVTKHEIEVLALSGTARRPWVAGMSSKTGLRWVKLLVDPRTALKRLRRMIARSASTVAEDNRTIDRRKVEGGGIVFSHRADSTKIWGRGKHWSNWGAPSLQNRAVLVVPR